MIPFTAYCEGWALYTEQLVECTDVMNVLRNLFFPFDFFLGIFFVVANVGVKVTDIYNADICSSLFCAYHP